MRTLCIAAVFAGCLAAQQGPSLRNLAEMTMNIGEVRIGADEHGRSELCDKLAAIRQDGFPVTPSAKADALKVQCQDRPARVFVLRMSSAVADPKRALCEYGAAPAGLAYERLEWITLRRGGLPMTGQEIRNRLEPLGVRTYAALLFSFGFERIDAHSGDKPRIEGPLHQIDGFCADL